VLVSSDVCVEALEGSKLIWTTASRVSHVERVVDEVSIQVDVLCARQIYFCCNFVFGMELPGMESHYLLKW
jgi:hypothetical protein